MESEHDKDSKNARQPKQDVVKKEDPPIIIKGGSLNVNYKRSSFDKDPADPTNGEIHKITTVKLINVTIEDKDTGFKLSYGSLTNLPGKNCTISIEYRP